MSTVAADFDRKPVGSQTVSGPVDHVAHTGGGRLTEAEVRDVECEGMNLHPINATHRAVPFCITYREIGAA